MKHHLGFDAWIRRALGVAAITGVVVVTGWDTNLLRKFSLVKTAKADSQPFLDNEGPLPNMDGAVAWLNSPPLSREALHGKVVLVNFWTYSCINSLRELPYMKAWAAKYRDAGLIVIGVHAPEFGFEKERANVQNAVRDLNVTYPVAIDSNHRIWDAFNNEYWPADYFIDGNGRIRYHHFGEGDYGESERVIQDLLKANGATGSSRRPAWIFARVVRRANPVWKLDRIRASLLRLLYRCLQPVWPVSESRHRNSTRHCTSSVR